jgi:glycosyltransferase involved in cell wall biosynthesis
VIPLSAFVITRNEEARLPAALTALRPWIEDILVVDSGSTDRTVDIARAMGARVIRRNWTGYGQQKRFAEQNCRYDWVLNVDADEVITPELGEEIRALFSSGRPPRPGAYRMRILTVYPGDDRPRRFANDYNVVRLYHRAAGSYREHALHDRVELKNVTPRQLRAPVHHYSCMSFDHLIEKGNRFSSFSAKNAKPRSGRLLSLRLFWEFPLNFFKMYVMRRHFTGGWKGFFFALCHALMRTSRIAKMLEQGSRKSWQTIGHVTGDAETVPNYSRSAG